MVCVVSPLLHKYDVAVVELSWTATPGQTEVGVVAVITGVSSGDATMAVSYTHLTLPTKA